MRTELNEALASLEEKECILVLFDVRIPGMAKRLHCERAYWQELSDIEALDEDHFVLIVRLGEGSEVQL